MACDALALCVHSMLPLICSATSHAWPLQAQDIEHCVTPIEMQYPAAADLLRQLLYLRSFATPECCTGTATCLVPPDIVAAVMLQWSDQVAQNYGSPVS